MSTGRAGVSERVRTEVRRAAMAISSRREMQICRVKHAHTHTTHMYSPILIHYIRGMYEINSANRKRIKSNIFLDINKSIQITAFY